MQRLPGEEDEEKRMVSADFLLPPSKMANSRNRQRTREKQRKASSFSAPHRRRVLPHQ